jgi:mannan endo-1,4-beta-mannosidase
VSPIREKHNLNILKFIPIVVVALTIVIIFWSYMKIEKIPFIESKDSFLFFKNTDKRFRFVGGNHFNLLAKYLWPNLFELSGEKVFETSAMYNITVIRFWATCADGFWSDQCLYGKYYDYEHSWNKSKEEFFQKFDGLVSDAEKHGIYLIPVLCDSYGTFKSIGDSEVCQVGSKANTEYKRFVQDVVLRYRNRSVIFAWEIGNEGNRQCSNVYDLLEWYDDSAKFIRSLDKNHIISTGENNFGTLDESPFKVVHMNENITAASVHIYSDDLFGIDNSTEKFILRWVNVSHNELKKPLYFGEFGVYNVSKDGYFYNEFLTNSFNLDVDGVILWSWMEGADCEKPAEFGGQCISPTRTPDIVKDVKFWADMFKASE